MSLTKVVLEITQAMSLKLNELKRVKKRTIENVNL